MSLRRENSFDRPHSTDRTLHFIKVLTFRGSERPEHGRAVNGCCAAQLWRLLLGRESLRSVDSSVWGGRMATEVGRYGA